MSTLEQAELNTVYQQVTEFSDEAMRQAIEAAREPGNAERFIQRLRDERAKGDEADESLVVGLCVALGEARAPAAIPLLLELATGEPTGFIEQEAALYVLQRMGEPAFQAAMALIESSQEPRARVLAYEILAAAEDAAPAVRQSVADFCIGRVPLETATRWPTDDWDPAMAVCTLLADLKDARVLPYVADQWGQASSEQREQWQYVRDSFDESERPDLEVDWRTDWPEQWRQWQEELDYDDEESEEEGLSDEEQALIDEFAQSAFVHGIRALDADYVVGEIQHFVEMGHDYIGLDACDLEVSDVREMLYEIMPRKFSAEPEFFENFPYLLEAFIHFLDSRGQVKHAKELLRLAEEARRRMPRLAADPANWGMAKSFFMRGKELGFDMTSQEGMNAFLEYYNANLAQAMSPALRGLPFEPIEEDEPFEEDDPFITSPSPIRRDAPKVGRNDPCPCGSGKKYKKCCGG